MIARIRRTAVGLIAAASLLAGCQTAYYGNPHEGQLRALEPCYVVDCECQHFVADTSGYCDCTHQHTFHLRLVR